MATISKLVIREDGTPGWWRKNNRKGKWKPRLDEQGKPVPKLDKRGKPRYCIQVHVGGSKRTMMKNFTRRKDAEEWAREIESRKAKGERVTTDRHPVAEYMEWWLRMKAQGAVRGRRGRKGVVPGPRTMSDYSRAVDRWILHPPPGLVPNLGEQRLDRLTCDVLDRCYDAMLRNGATPDAIQRLNGILGQALEDAVRKGSLARNPTDWASIPQVPKRPAPEAMDKEQATRFLAAARKDRYSALWHLLLYGGLRPGEAFALRWKDVDFEAGAVRVVYNLVRVTGVKGWKMLAPKTKKSSATIPLPPVVMQELKAWKSQQTWDRVHALEWVQSEHEFVFTTLRGTPLHGARRSFERVMRAAGLGTEGPQPKRKSRSGPAPQRPFKPQFRMYDLRHTMATMLLLAGVNIKVVQERLRHATISQTADTYSHVLPTMQRDAADKLGEMFGSSG